MSWETHIRSLADEHTNATLWLAGGETLRATLLGTGDGYVEVKPFGAGASRRHVQTQAIVMLEPVE